jgi:putative DNA primase/helicase
MTTPLDLVLGKLRAAGCDPSPTGKDSYESRCPAHRGDRKNLSVKLGDNGAVILHCHHVGDTGRGTCPADSIAQSLGLRLEDLWPKSNGTTSAGKTSGKKTWPDLGKAVHAVTYHLKPTKPPDTWTYNDAHGNPIMAVVRFDTADGKKTYRPFHRLPDGTWAVGDPPGLLPLYRLPEVIKKAGPIFVTEGEKCVHALSRFRAVATTSAHGSESPHKTDWTPLAGKPVVILPDNDPPGEGYAASVLRILKRLDPRPPWVRVVGLPGLADGADVADWIPRVLGDRGGDEAQKAIQDELARLVEAAPAGLIGTRSRTPPPKPHDLRATFQRLKPRSLSRTGPIRPRTWHSMDSRARWSG